MSDTKSSSANETGYVVSKHSLQALANRIADLEAQNALLRAVAVAFHEYDECSGGRCSEELEDCRRKYQAAIDGGALPSQWQQATGKILDERHELWQQMADSDGGEMEEPIT